MTMRCLVVLYVIIAAYGQSKSPQPLSEPKQSIGTPAQNPSLQQFPGLKELTNPTAQVVPNPAQYDPAYLTAVNQLHEFQIRDLIGRVTSLESSRTLIWGVGIGLIIFAAFLRHFWKSIFRMLTEESGPSKIISP